MGRVVLPPRFPVLTRQSLTAHVCHWTWLSWCACAQRGPGEHAAVAHCHCRQRTWLSTGWTCHAVALSVESFLEARCCCCAVKGAAAAWGGSLAWHCPRTDHASIASCRLGRVHRLPHLPGAAPGYGRGTPSSCSPGKQGGACRWLPSETTRAYRWRRRWGLLCLLALRAGSVACV